LEDVLAAFRGVEALVGPNNVLEVQDRDNVTFLLRILADYFETALQQYQQDKAEWLAAQQDCTCGALQADVPPRRAHPSGMKGVS
jgi:hypothetical protein